MFLNVFKPSIPNCSYIAICGFTAGISRLIDGKPLYEIVGEKVAEWGSAYMGNSYSYVGAVYSSIYVIILHEIKRCFILIQLL